MADGNSAPDSIHIGMRKRFMTAWKPCEESSTQAMQKPRPVRPTEAKVRTAKASA